MNLALLVTLAVAVSGRRRSLEVEPVGLVTAEVESLGDVFEQERSDKECTSLQFKCNNNKCIGIQWRCDGDIDCGDGSDELECGCTGIGVHTYFKCNNGNCLSPNYVGDDNDDCGDGSDEGLCSTDADCPNGLVCGTDGKCDASTNPAPTTPQGCDNNQFQCKNSECIPKRRKCDKFNDCGDDSDEENCGCVDRSSWCSYHKEYCNIPNVIKNCRKTCGLCDAPTTPAPTTPQDEVSVEGSADDSAEGSSDY